MTDLDALLRAALDDAVAPAPPFDRVERRHRARRTRRVMTAAVAVVAIAAASAFAGQRLGTVEPTRRDLKPFDGFRTDETARAGFDRCRDTLPRDAFGIQYDVLARCFREQGYEAPPPDFVESGYHHWLHDDDDPIALSGDWPGPCHPTPLPGDPTATVLAEGDLDGLPWSIVAYEGADGTICATWNQQHRPGVFGGYGITPRVAGGMSPVDDNTGPVGAPRYWANLAAGEHSSGPGGGIAFFWAPVRPDVMRVRITFDGRSHDVATVASPLAPDRRFVAAGLLHDGWHLPKARYGAVLYDATGREVGRLGRPGG